MEKLIEELKAAVSVINEDIDKKTKASEARVRKATLVITEAGAKYRKQSIAQHVTKD